MSSVKEEQFMVMFRDALEDALGSVPRGVEIDADLRDLELDSLSWLGVVTALESRLRTRLHDSALQDIKTGRDLFGAFASALAEEGA